MDEDFGFGIVLGLVLGWFAALVIIALTVNSDSYERGIVCERYFGGVDTDAGCVVKDRVVEFKTK